MEHDIPKKIASLAQLDIDAYHAYEKAIQEIEDPDIRMTLETFREQHMEHYKTHSETLRMLGEKPPDFSPDFKGYIIQGFTSIVSKMGTDNALRAMKSNEELTNKKYSEAMNWNLSDDIMDTISRAYDDEINHLAYIEEVMLVKHQ